MWHCASTNRAFPPLLVLSLSISGALKTHRRCPSARLNDALTGTVYLFVPSAGSKQALPPRTKHLASSRKRLYCLAHFGISFFCAPGSLFCRASGQGLCPAFFYLTSVSVSLRAGNRKRATSASRDSGLSSFFFFLYVQLCSSSFDDDAVSLIEQATHFPAKHTPRRLIRAFSHGQCVLIGSPGNVFRAPVSEFRTYRDREALVARMLFVFDIVVRWFGSSV